MTKEEKKDEMKNRISMALKDPILQQGFECICKENAELKEVHESDKRSLALIAKKGADFEKAYNEAEELLDKQIEATYKLDKENKELKEELKKWKDEWQEQVQKATDEGYARTLQTIQLTKAKEIIKTFLGFIQKENRHSDYCFFGSACNSCGHGTWRYGFTQHL